MDKPTLDAALARIAELEAELAEDAALRTRMGDILTLTVNALKGEPDSRSLHDWATLPEVAREVVADYQTARTAVDVESALVRQWQAHAAALRDALEELVEVARLRGDNELPHPSDDPKLWTARMQDAWDNAADLLEAPPAAQSLAAQEGKPAVVLLGPPVAVSLYDPDAPLEEGQWVENGIVYRRQEVKP